MNDSRLHQFLQSHGYELWETDGFGTLICPCGFRVEPDGKCKNGHTSPLRKEGLI